MREGRNGRIAAVALIALVGLACWWALRSESTETSSRDTVAPDAEKTRAAEERRVEATRRNEERAARKERAAEELAADARTLVVRVVVKDTGGAVGGARVVVRGENLSRREATTDAAGSARFADFSDGYARIETTAPGFAKGSAFTTTKTISADAPIVVEVEPGVSLDGVVCEDSDGRGIAGARVVASGQAGFVAETTSGADGAFHLDGLPASRPRYASHAVALSATEDHHLSATVGWNPADGGRVEIRMRPAGVVRGRVVEPSGAPAQWATVIADAAETTRTLASVRAQTDADGRYEMAGLALDRKWRVVASKPTFVDSLPSDDVALDPGRGDATCDLMLRGAARVVVRVFRPNGSPGAGAKLRLVPPDGRTFERTADASGACDISVVTLGKCVLAVEDWGFAAATLDVDAESGVRRDVDVHLQPGATLAGFVVDDAGAPIADAVLVARAAGSGPTNTWTHHDLTEQDGSFRISGLAAGDVVVDVSCSEGHDALSRVPATAPANDVRFVLRRDGGVTFRLRAPAGASPPKQIGVTFVPRDRRGTKSFEMSQQHVPWSDDAVRVATGAGEWTIVIHAAGSLPVSRDVDVSPGADTSLGDILLDVGLTVEGRVVDAEGRPVKGAVVSIGARVAPANPDAAVPPGWRYVDAGGGFVDLDRVGGVLSGGSDADGAFRVEHLAPGPRSFTANAPGYVPTTVSCDVAAGAAPLVVTLRRGGVLRCTVRESDGKPAVGIFVYAVSDDPAGAAPSSYGMTGGLNGAFSQRVPGGRAHVVVRRGETTLATKDVDVREGADTAVEITLEK